MLEPDTAFFVFKNNAFFRRQSKFKDWPLDGRLSVWIEIVRHTTDKLEYVCNDRGFTLHIIFTLKHTLPDYGWPAADEKLQRDLKYHLGHFDMPAWSRIMEKLAHGNEYDSLQVAMEQLRAYAVKSPRLPGLDGVQAPSLVPPESHHITMDGMVHTLTEIINEAEKIESCRPGPCKH